MVQEAHDVTRFVLTGQEVWLPWSTIAELDPLSKFEDMFGLMDIDEIEKLQQDRSGFQAEQQVVQSYLSQLKVARAAQLRALSETYRRNLSQGGGLTNQGTILFEGSRAAPTEPLARNP